MLVPTAPRFVSTTLLALSGTLLAGSAMAQAEGPPNARASEPGREEQADPEVPQATPEGQSAQQRARQEPAEAPSGDAPPVDVPQTDAPPADGDAGTMAQQSSAEESAAPGTGEEGQEAEREAPKQPQGETGQEAAGGAAIASEGEGEPAGEDVSPADVGKEGDAEAPAEQVPRRLNPLPEGEEELLGKHPVDWDSATFKPGTGLSFTSKDDLFSMAIRARIQFRDELDVSQGEFVGDDGGTTTGTMTENTFGIRRARIQFKGYAFGENNRYKAEFAFSPNDLGFDGETVSRTPLLSYFAEFTHLRDLSLRIGQYKLLYSRQRVISSGDLAFVDRSLAQNEFNLDRDIGFQFFSEDLFGLEMFKYYAGATLGEGRDAWQNENFTSGDGGYQYLARLEFLPFGDFNDYSEVDFERLDKVRMSVGAAYAYLDNGSRTEGYMGDPLPDDGVIDYHNAAADVLMKWAGLSFFGEFYYRNGHRGQPVDISNPANIPRDGVGYTAQFDYLLPGLPIGVGARYSGLTSIGDEGTTTSLSTDNELGATVGWFMAGHPLKLQGDYFHFWSDDFSEVNEQVRVQLQVAY